ncbi:MAG: hypothetical protein MH112_12770 [Phenylobacterium sp.]|uniref:hypothetical protein n=1 Tax=Phenylobacterium sp. TaxID=1871053 RepID=UPI0025CE6135|nr:hypothetical protein [Phenylobacterium sp.]MCG9917215.1 hypothetical protein [Phenylobacterium sp.]
MTESRANSDRLDEEWRDKLVAIGKGIAGSIPVAGGLVGEVVGSVIPGQRADRIAAYLRALAARVDLLSLEVRDGLAANVEKIDLIEEGGFQSARATSKERIDHIVEAVNRGLSEDDADVIRRKRLLLILGQLDDDEVNLLNAYGRAYAGADRQAFERINRPEPLHMGSLPSAVDQSHLYEAGKDHLLRLDLLKKNYSQPRKGETPEFDARKGDFKHTVEVSYLGRMLLREIGMETPFDSQQGGR